MRNINKNTNDKISVNSKEESQGQWQYRQMEDSREKVTKN